METTDPGGPNLTPWQHLCLHRLHRLLELTPDAAPDMATLEAFALLEWCRMVVFDECLAAGVGAAARAMLRGARRQSVSF